MDQKLINIHLEGSSRSWNLRIPSVFFTWLRYAARFALVLTVLFSVQTAFYIYDSFSLKSSLSRRVELQSQLAYLEKRLDRLQNDVDYSFENEDHLYMKYGFNPPDHGARKLGIGGPVPPETLLMTEVNPAHRLRTGVSNKAEQISKQIDRSITSYSTLKNHLEQKFTNWRHIPSISPTTGRFSSAFGLRTHPITGERNKMHAGIDISNSKWTPIFATADGVVNRVQHGDFFGNFVVIDHGNGFITKYGHMHQAMVKPGQFVKRYDFLGYMGNTGRSTGNHLHYEVHFNGKPQNPMRYILPDSYAVE